MRDMLTTKNIKINILLMAVLLSGIFVISDMWTGYNIGRKVENKNSSQNPSKNSFSDIVLQAKSAFVYDIVKNKTLFSKNSEIQLPLASLTKIMTVLTVKDYSKSKNNLKHNKVITISPYMIKPEGDSGLFVGEKWSLRNIIDFTLTVSSNDGARAIASIGALEAGDSSLDLSSFIKRMNYEARNIGLRQTYFLNESGLDMSDNIAGAYGSARDVAVLFSKLYKKYPKTLEATTYKSFKINSINNISHTANNTNKIINDISGLVASKTGFTDLSGGNLVIIYEAGPMRPIAISVLGSTADDRFTDMKKLIKASLQSL